ncbi:MAG: aldose 1-epimerase [Burkholderiaceae bacterium]
MTSSVIALAAGPMRCEIAPALGGCIAGLWLDGVPVLRSTPASELHSARFSGSYPLVPFSNRVGSASLQWDGTNHPLVKNHATEPHSIHGIGWQRPWEVLEADARSALLSFEHRGGGDWPFEFDTSQTFRLSEEGLALTISVTNQSGRHAPFGLGWHPYFVKRADAVISFAASGRWEMGADNLPTRRVASTGIDGPCAALDVDHCFDGWTGETRLADGVLDVTVRSSLRRQVVFTNPQRDFVAIEPVSHVNNAVNLVAAGAGPAELGLAILAPGESFSAQMSIDVKGVK